MRMTYFKSMVLALIIVLNFSLAYAAEIPTYTEAKTAFIVSADQDEFIIKLKSNPTTGYSWFLRDYDGALIQPLKHKYIASTDRKLMGASGYELWTFKVKPAGFNVPKITSLRFTYARPWESEDNANQMTFRITTKD